MKNIIFALPVLFISLCYGQINLEHTYSDGIANRIVLENSGEIYYVLDQHNKQAKIYNANHNLWKTIDLPTTPNATIVGIYHLSENKINADNLIELAYTYYSVSGSTLEYESRIINENGTSLLTVPGASSLFLSEFQGMPNKIIAYMYGMPFYSKVFSVPGLNHEHTYNDGIVYRVMLENSGEKYYLLDDLNKKAKIYNSDHTIWKTINLPTTPEATISAIYHLSENKINPDNLIELAYTYYRINGSTIEYESRIINESGTNLLTIPDASSIFLNEIQGIPNKLLANIHGQPLQSKVYSVPGLTLEHTYTSGNISRIKMENSGEKYYLLDITNKQAKLYNSDHSSWKTVNLPTTPGATIIGIYDVSETKIDPDNNIEISYTYYFTEGSSVEYEGRVINENGITLLTVHGATSLFLSEIAGLNNKLIAHIHGNFTSSKVYGLPSTTTKTMEHNKNLIRIFPNPASDFISLTSNDLGSIDKISIYNQTGIKMLEIYDFDNGVIDISGLKSGVYIFVGEKNGEILLRNGFVVL